MAKFQREREREWGENSENRRGRIICTLNKFFAKAFTIKVKSAKVFIQRVYNKRDTEKKTQKSEEKKKHMKRNENKTGYIE